MEVPELEVDEEGLRMPARTRRVRREARCTASSAMWRSWLYGGLEVSAIIFLTFVLGCDFGCDEENVLRLRCR